MENRRINRKYSPEFKISCIIDMRDHNLSYSETTRKYLCEKGQESIFKGRLKL